MNKILWKDIDWALVQSRINRYQRRIYKASKNNEKLKVKSIQKRLISSLDSKLIAVRRVTTENKRKKTADIDNKLYNTDEKKVKLIKKIKIDGLADPIKRIYIPKPGKIEKRPLGIPTILDRAKQYIVLLALEPEWEAKFEPNSYGFRPGRNCHDAVQAIFTYLRSGTNNPNFKRYVLDADLKGCFDNIDHKYLLNKLDTLPEIKNQVKAWFEAGIVQEFRFDSSSPISKNEIETPQGGIISPFLANVALHGMENHLKNWVSQRPSTTDRVMSKIDKKRSLGVIRYADDFIIIHNDQQTILDAKVELQNWFNNSSKLMFNEGKSNIITSTEGFKFLGFHFINIKKNGKYKAKIYPDKSSVKRITDKLSDKIKKSRALSSYDLIQILRPIIIGWCNYYCISECYNTFSRLNHTTYQILRAWVFRRDKRHGRNVVKEKYFESGNTYSFRGKEYSDNWILVGRKKMENGEIKTNYLPKFTWTESQRHIKVIGDASIYDGNKEYWLSRTFNYSDFSFTQQKLLKRQRGYCTWCKTYITVSDTVEIDHIIPKSKFGKSNMNNIQLLHKQCHKDKTLKDNKL